MLPITYVVVALPLLWLLLWWWNDLWYVLLPSKLQRRRLSTGFKLPPGSMGIPIIGEMLTFLWYFKFIRRPDEFISSKVGKYGEGVGLYKSHLFGSPSIIACSPAINRYIFLNSEDFVMNWPNVETVGVNSLVAVHGESHARLRTFVTNAVNQPDALRRVTLLVQPRLVAALRSWAQKGKITAFAEIKKVTFANIGKLFAGFEPGPQLDNLDKLFMGVMGGIRASRIYFPGTAFYESFQCRKKLDAIFMKELESRKTRNGDSITEMDDLMDGLMKIQDKQGNKLADQEVIDNIVSLVLAGYESTSLASMWAIYYLAKFPHILQKLRDENIRIRENRIEEFITSEDVSKLKYTNMVVEETIRMANIAAFLFRTATKDVQYKGYTIPKGWNVVVWLRNIHTNPENFEDPMCFNPDRWTKPASPGTYQVFGLGPRICAGNMLARIQVAILLHHLAVGYKWELVNPDAGNEYLPHPKPTDGVEIAFTKI